MPMQIIKTHSTVCVQGMMVYLRSFNPDSYSSCLYYMECRKTNKQKNVKHCIALLN